LPSQERILRVAFLAGAITDALALFPLVIPGFASRIWGFENFTGSYSFVAGYAAALMLGWTILLVWAYQRPLERIFVAPLTILVIYGLVITEVAALASGHIALEKIAPTLCLQAVLVALFASGAHYGTVRRLLPA
jgi:hypothetical protein